MRTPPDPDAHETAATWRESVAAKYPVAAALTEAEADAYDGDAEAHYCDFPLCPCDDNQNRLLAESREYYAQDIELERRMGWEEGTV